MSRRWGTGSLEQLPSGAWRARIRIGGERLTETFASRVDAREWLEGKVGQRSRATGGRRANATLGELRDEYIEDLKRAGRRDSTLDRMASHVDAVLKDYGETRLREIDGPFLERAVEAMLGRGWANATVRNRVGVLTGIARYGQRRGYVAAVPLPVRRPKVALETRPEPLTTEQEKALVDAARRQDDPRYLCALGLALWAGLRREELVRFRRSHLDVRRREIRTPDSKTGAEGPIPIRDELVEAILACPVPKDDAPLLRIPSPGALSHWISPIWWGAGVDGTVRLHRLRHTWATRLGERGATLAQLLAWGRWSTLSAARRYLHEGHGLDRSVVDRATNVPRGKPKRATPVKKARRSR